MLRLVSNSRKAHYIPDSVIQRTISLQGLSEQILILPHKRKVSQLEHKNAVIEGSAPKQNMPRVTKKDTKETLGRFHHFIVKILVHILNV